MRDFRHAAALDRAIETGQQAVTKLRPTPCEHAHPRLLIAAANLLAKLDDAGGMASASNEMMLLQIAIANSEAALRG